MLPVEEGSESSTSRIVEMNEDKLKSAIRLFCNNMYRKCDEFHATSG